LVFYIPLPVNTSRCSDDDHPTVPVECELSGGSRIDLDGVARLQLKLLAADGETRRPLDEEIHLLL